MNEAHESAASPESVSNHLPRGRGRVRQVREETICVEYGTWALVGALERAENGLRYGIVSEQELLHSIAAQKIAVQPTNIGFATVALSTT